MLSSSRLSVFAALLISCLSAAEKPNFTAFGDLPQDLFTRAARDGDTAVMRQLLEAYPDEIDINFSDDSTRPPLHEALRFRRTDAALLLLDAGAEAGIEKKDVYRTTNDALSPLAMAVIGDDRVVLKRLLEMGERPQLTFRHIHPTILAMENDHVECLDLLIKYGVDPLEVDYGRGYRTEPIHMRAAFVGAHRVLRRLIEAGADPNHKSKNGLTPLHLAASSRSLDTVNVLLDAGADVNARFRWAASFPEVTPLIRAVEAGDLMIVERLLDAGADVSVDRNRALYCADLRADRAIYDRLLQAGARREDHRFAPTSRKVLFDNVEVGVTDTLEKALEALSARSPGPTSRSPDVTRNVENKKPTMAVFYDDDSANWANLLLADITETGRPALLERSRLDAILAEAGLRSSGFTSEALTHALALTPAEYALVISGNRLHSDGSLAAIQARLVALDGGAIIRTWLLSADAKTTQDATQVMAESIAALVGHTADEVQPTLAVLNRFPVSEASIATHPSANDFNLLLEQGLGARKSIRLLDRRGLDRILSEQALAGRAGENILQGGWFIEGGLVLENDGQMTVSVKLTDGAGASVSQRIGPATAERAAEETATWILSETGTREAASFDRRKEADRLMRLAEWSLQTRQLEEGIRLADAAWALDPDRWQTRLIRLNARRAFVGSRVGALSDARSRANGKKLIGVTLDEGFFGALDPLEWYDLAIEPEQFLLRLQESYLLMRTLATQHPAEVRRQEQAIRVIYYSLGAAFSWFAPIHQQERHASSYSATKQAARQATDALLAAFDDASPGNNKFLVDFGFLRQLPYFYDQVELESLFRRAIRESAEAIENRDTAALFSRHLNWHHFRKGNTGYHARPVYPMDFWRKMADELQEEPDWASQLMGIMAARATGPEAAVGSWNDDMIKVLKPAPPNPKLRLFGLSLSASMTFRGHGAPEVLMREVREWGESESIIYLEPRELGEIAGYNKDYLHQARLMRKLAEGKLTNLRFHYRTMRANDIASVDRFMNALQMDEAANDGVEFIAPRQVFHPFAHDRRLDERFSKFDRQATPLIVTDHALWAVYKMRFAAGKQDFPAVCVYRFDHQSGEVSEFMLPKAFAKDGFPRNARIGIAESETHVLATASRGGAIGVYDKASGKWTVLDGYTGAGLAGAFSVEGGFIFLAGMGAPDRNRHGTPLHSHMFVLHYNTQTGETRRLADNRKVPADYAFEDPGLSFTELQVSRDGRSFNVKGDLLRPRDGWLTRNFKGSVRLSDGKWLNKGLPIRREWELQVGPTRYYLFHKPGVVHEGPSFFLVEKGNSDSRIEIPIDHQSVLAAIDAFELPSNHPLSKSDITGRRARYIVVYGETVAVIESTVLRFYDVADILRVLSQSTNSPSSPKIND